MAIPAEVVEEFDAKIRERGHEYFISGDVKITETLDGLIRACAWLTVLQRLDRFQRRLARL